MKNIDETIDQKSMRIREHFGYLIDDFTRNGYLSERDKENIIKFVIGKMVNNKNNN